MESEKLSCSGLYWLCKEAENRSSAADSPASEVPTPLAALESPDLKAEGVVLVEEAPTPAAGEKRRRGRPARGEGRAAPAPAKRMKKKKEDEDVCFICFDGGSLVLCDRGDCPKAYHPACIKRDEAFFRSKAKWNCGWHICSKCQKSSARYMCYTCTYSLCKGCTRDSDYLCVRENKGFCSTCFRVVKMIENIDQENVETVQVDFDDKLSWEYLFKVYWICLKRDLSLTLDEITRAQKPWTAAPTKVTRREKYPAVYYPGNKGNMTTVNPTVPNNAISYTSVKSVRENNTTFIVSTSWASKELLDFAAYMRNGDTSALSQKEVQALLFDYIKRNNLRDPHQRSEIICDSKLEKLFGKPRVRHFEMLSLLEFHFLTKDEIHGDIINPAVRQVAGESKSDNLPMISENYTNKIDKMDEERVDINRSHEIKNTCEKLDKHVDSSGSTNNGPKNQACLKSDSFSGVKSETSVASLSTGSTPSANDREAENSWHYRDPNGKVQGPFSIEQLNKWSTTAIFPLDMKIWRLKTEERDSVLLTDVIKDQIRLQNNLSLSPQDAKGTSESTNSVGIDTDAHSNGKLEMIEGNGRVLNSSNGKISEINNDPQIKNDAKINNSSVCLDLEQPKVVNSNLNHNLNQPEDNNDARNKNSSKYMDLEKSKVVNSYLNQPQVVNDTQITNSSKCQEPKLPKGVNSNLNQPEVNNDDHIKSVSKCQEPEKTKVIYSHLNQPQVNNDDTHIKNSSKCPVPEQFKVVNTNLNQPLVKNDARIKKFSKCREPNKTKVVNSDLNQPQVKNDTQIKKSSKRRDRDQTKVVNSNLNQPQDNSDARIKNSLKYRDQTKAVNSNSNLLQEKNNTQIKNSSVCWDPEPPKVLTSNLNQPLVENDTQINNSSNCLEPEQPKIVNSYMNQPQVKNDTQINNSSKCREPEQPKVVDSHINQPQINGDKNFSKFQEPDLTKVVNPNLNQPEVHDDAQIKSSSIFWDLEQPKVVNPNLNQPQVDDNARVNNFSKFWDPEPPKVVNPNLNQPQFNDHTRVNNSSKFWDSEPPKVVNPNLNQPQVNNDARVNNSSKFWDPEPSNVVNSNFNQPQVNNDTHIKNSSKCWEPEQPKVVTSFLNQAQVHNDTQIKNSSKYWDPEPSRAAVDPYLNQPQVHSMVRSSPLEENPHENIVHQERNKMGHMWNPSPNYENWSSQGNMISQTTGKQFHEIQINEQHYLRQNTSANPWNSDESRPHYTAMANLADSSQQKFNINLQEFPMPMPKISSAVSEDQTIKEQQRWPPPQISVQNIGIHNMLSLTPKSIDHDEKDYFRNQKITSDFEKVRASDNKHSLSSKPSMMEWNSDFLSVCSTSKNDELPPPSPPNPVPNASSWLAMMTEPIEFNTLAEESVSDLLAEVDAMESNSDMESPNMLMDYADDLFQDSKTDCFISLRGFISPHDRVKEEALCSSGDTQLATPQSNFSDEKIRAPNNDFPIDLSRKSKKHSSCTSSVMEVETKRFDNIPDNRHNISPPKKIRDLADIMNAPAKHGNLNSSGRESGQGTPRGSGSKKRSTMDGISGGRESSHQKHGGEREKLTSPRDRNGSNALISPRDRNISGGRPSWSRQSSFGGGSGNNNSRSIPRGQRVCKFYENGYCRKGAFCDYLHP